MPPWHDGKLPGWHGEKGVSVRQRVLDKAKPPQLDLIIEEMVLRRTMDEPAMMAAALSEEDSGRLIADVAGKLRSAT